MASLDAPRALGSPPPPRRRFVAPAAVRIAQLTLLLRIAIVLAVVLTVSAATQPVIVIDGDHLVRLPSGATWSGLSPWVVAGSVFEGFLALRLGVLGDWSRRVVLLVEAAAIALSGMYVAAGQSGLLVVLVTAITTVVLLRLDHVRHSFAKAAFERRLLGRRAPGGVFDGYRMPEPTAHQARQLVGYHAGVDVPAD